ncbi:MAG: histidine kinase [Acidobacteriota bacterium]|nr:histidine kinase [Acidobacteriota bacterium]
MHRTSVKRIVIVAAGLIGLGTLLSSLSTHWGRTDRPERARVRAGDQMVWKDPAFDDSDWLTYSAWQRLTGPYQGNLWLRQPLKLGDDPSVNTFVLVAVGSSEVYFDGELIGRNGVVGDSRDTEVPGSLLFMCSIPGHLLKPGDHEVALRFSNHRGISRFYLLGAGIGSIQDVVSFTRRTLFPFLFLSVFLVVALYFFVLYALNRQQASHLAFASLCGLTGLLLFVESIRSFGYPYHWHGHRLYLVMILSGILAGLVPLFFILHHGLSRRWLIGIPAALLVGAAMFHRSLDQVSFGFFTCAFIYAQAVVCFAFLKEKTDSWIGLLGINQALIVLALTRLTFLEQWLFGCFTLLIVLMLISLSLQSRRQRAQFQEARLRSARLQIELLQKHLQPHFMLNTLTAVMEWLEREPKAGVAFVGLLAQEMKTLNRFSSQTLVSLEEELRLCRNHLEILAYRNGEEYPFQTVCENPDLEVPPAIILTLVENGVSYALDEGTLQFEMRQRITPTGRVHIDFKAVGVDIHIGEADDGTGSKYIKARLEESFPGRWRLNASGNEQTWVTNIEFEGGP